MPIPSRDDALALLHEYTHKPGLIRHALAVEAAMAAAARRFGEPVELWRLTGLLHDFDYERWPDPPDHPLKGSAILAERGYPQEVIRAIQGHATYLNVPRDTLMARALFAVDELSGFIVACALMTPNRRLAELTVEGVRKKLKSKGFAAAVSREDIAIGAAEMEVELDDLIALTVSALQGESEALGLA
jgi:putative nucleotidyltransferase with HDIG domain